MYSFTNFKEEDQKRAVKVAKDMLPDDAEILLLSFTGGRAFGWGGEHHDLDIHGFFAYDEDWFFKCHSNTRGFDMTLNNVQSVENPKLRWGRWKQYYDKSNPFYTHDKFDFEKDFISNCKPEYVQHIFPRDLNLQFARMDLSFSTRSALHTYKEMMIPLYYLETGEIESNVIGIINKHESFGYEELSKCGEKYKTRDGSINIDEQAVRDELEELYRRIAKELEENTDYEPSSKEIHGPPMPSEQIPDNGNA